MKQTEIALKESEKHYSRISETVPIILYDYILYPDGSNKFLYIGPTCREILEIDDKELLSNMNLFWQMVHPDDLQHLKDEDIKANKSRDLFMSEFRIITPSGRLKWIQLSSRPNSDSEIWSGYILDITERKNAELIIQKQNVQLTELNATKDKFFNIIAHDLRNPFAGILGISELTENILLEDNGEKPRSDL
ncbi:MAG: PAS domain-containing protein [Leptospiraceae bacterium]|nr:PAS domain-containing protein [Leptospiraceae bacterium]